MADIFRQCVQCRLPLPLTAFGKNSFKRDGIHYYCRRCVCDRAKRHYHNNPERAAKRVRDKNRENPLPRREAAKRWAQSHPEQRRATEAARRARKYGVQKVGRISFKTIRERDGNKCWICGQHVNRKDLSYDHAIPLIKGGEHSTRNLRIAHLSCNISKNSKDIEHQMFLL